MPKKCWQRPDGDMSADLNFPLIYCNGDSYSDPAYRPCMATDTYAHHVANSVQGAVINNAISGSCNRRIIRSSCHDLLLLREHNPTQKIIALIGFSFEIRDELWINDLTQDRAEQESNFRTHQFSNELNWKRNLYDDKLMVRNNNYSVDKKFLQRWSEGRAYFYSPYAERINFLMDVMLFKTMLEQHNIEYCMFQSPLAEKLETEHLLDFFKTRIQDPRIFDFETFSFCQWCCNNKFHPLDSTNPADIGHYGPDAHLAFAKEILIPKLKELSIL
jgi:hypothetical protein